MFIRLFERIYELIDWSQTVQTGRIPILIKLNE